jgi:hypothetical protein
MEQLHEYPITTRPAVPIEKLSTWRDEKLTEHDQAGRPVDGTTADRLRHAENTLYDAQHPITLPEPPREIVLPEQPRVEVRLDD